MANDNDAEIGASSTLGRSASVRRRIRATSLSAFWSRAATQFARNIKFGWPIFAFLLLFGLSSSWALYATQHGTNSLVNSYWDALYLTWATMTTIGNPESTNAPGRVLTSLDSFMGLITFGAIVWLITYSLSEDD
jgi:Ion channel